MKGKKYKTIALTLVILCLSVVPVHALSYTGVSQFTNTGAYIGGYSYTSASGYDYISAYSVLSCDGDIKDTDGPRYSYDTSNLWAQANVGVNKTPGTYWSIRGTHYAYINGSYTYKTSSDSYTEY
ncbi:MAG: hypothetical protein APF84_13600 [Gracilibacter sp. BRH_c7a]|nr:MAG: hypothetical protein APF84_13600 [Gracilibacter sp. BRH_c7a]